MFFKHLIVCLVFLLVFASSEKSDAQRAGRIEPIIVRPGRNPPDAFSRDLNGKFQGNENFSKLKLEQAQDNLIDLARTTGPVGFEPRAEADGIWYVSPKHPRLKFRYDAISEGEMWLTAPIRGPPLIMSLLEPTSNLSLELDELSRNGEIPEIRQVEPQAILTSIDTLEDDLPILLFFHTVKIGEIYYLSNLSETKLIHSGALAPVINSPKRDIILFSCESACFPGSRAGIVERFGEFDAKATFRKLKSAGTMSDVLQAVALAGRSDLLVTLPFTASARKAEINGETGEGGMIRGYVSAGSQLSADSGTSQIAPTAPGLASAVIAAVEQTNFCALGEKGLFGDTNCIELTCYAARKFVMLARGSGFLPKRKFHAISAIDCQGRFSQTAMTGFFCTAISDQQNLVHLPLWPDWPLSSLVSLPRHVVAACDAVMRVASAATMPVVRQDALGPAIFINSYLEDFGRWMASFFSGVPFMLVFMVPVFGIVGLFINLKDKNPLDGLLIGAFMGFVCVALLGVVAAGLGLLPLALVLAIHLLSKPLGWAALALGIGVFYFIKRQRKRVRP